MANWEKARLLGDVGKDAEVSCSRGDRTATKLTGAMEKDTAKNLQSSYLLVVRIRCALSS